MMFSCRRPTKRRLYLQPICSFRAVIAGAKANTAKHSPVEATAVTTERLLSKYCDRMVTVGRKLKQYPKPEITPMEMYMW